MVTCADARMTGDSDPKHVAWAKSYLALLDALQKYVKQWHTTGVAWNPQVG